MEKAVKATIVNYGMGNLFSIRQACLHVGMDTEITKDKNVINASDIIILPGVGAFGKAMEELKKHQLDEVIKGATSAGKIIFGVCLGMQLMFSKSFEFGEHQGLGLIQGQVLNLRDEVHNTIKIPNTGWRSIDIKQKNGSLQSLENYSNMYFVHSYYAIPDNTEAVSSTTRLGEFEFCASIEYKNIFGCQFHPEKSGEKGLAIYHEIKKLI